MVSTKQLVANKRNAELSTGPKSKIGLKVSSMNAVKHGLLSKESVLEEEDSSELDDFAVSVRNSLQPQDGIENLLVERVISCAWRLKRVLKVEAFLFSGKELWSTYLGSSDGLSFEAEKAKKVLLLSRYETALERSLYRALNELKQLRVVKSAIEADGFVS